MKKLISFLLSASIACGGFALPVLSAEETNYTNLENLRGLNGTWTQENGGLRGVGSGDCFAMSDTEISDFSFTAKVKIKNSGAASLVFRSNDSGSQAYVANVDLTRGTARMFKFPATGVFEFGEISVDRSQKEYTLRVDCIGESISYYIDGKPVAVVNDSSYSAGKLGLLIWSSDTLFTDIQYTPIAEANKPALTALSMNGIDGGIRFDESITDFHSRLPYETDAIRLTAKADEGTRLSVSAQFGSQTVLAETSVESGKSSPEIPLWVGVTTVTYRLEKDCALTQSGKITLTYTVTVRRMKQGESADYDLSYADVVNKMTDLSALADPVKAGESSGESTSYDRRSVYNEITGKYQNWDANDDHGDNLPRQSDGGLVLADVSGAGALVRFWSAEPRSGHIKIYIDGNTTPAVDMPFSDFFGGDFPFNLSEISYDASRGMNCYLPITYNESCKVIAYGDWGRYYHVGYITFPEGTTVEPFSLPLSADGQKALLDAQATFAGLSAKSVGSEQTVTVPAGKSVNLFTASGAGAITKITVKLEDLAGLGDDWNALAQLAVSAYWDGEASPSVWTTLGGFFGSTCGTNAYSSLPMGVYEDGTMYASWYMPYSDGAKLVLQNDGDTDRKITYSVETESLTKAEADGLLRFHAKWNRLTDPARGERFPDSSILSVSGSGRFVGMSMHIYKEYGVGDPTSHSDWWWGEGDEKFFVDGEKFPSWFGTGSEDYFGYAWGSWYPFNYPYHAQPFTNGGMWGIGNRLNNRFHIMDQIPFAESFDAYIEKYHRNGYSNQVVTAYFYLEKGQDDGYGAVSLEARTEYYDLPYPEPSLFYEGEAMKIIECTGMEKAETQEMSSYGNDWSGGSQLIFKAQRDNYVKLYINVPETAVYDISAVFTKARDFGVAQHYLDGVPLGDGIDLFNNSVIRSKEITIDSGITLTEGLHVLEVRIPDKNSRSVGYFYGLDLMRLTKVGDAEPPVTDDAPVTDDKPATTTSSATTSTPVTSNAPVQTSDPTDQTVEQDGSLLPLLLAAGAVAIGAGIAVALILTKRKK